MPFILLPGPGRHGAPGSGAGGKYLSVLYPQSPGQPRQTSGRGRCRRPDGTAAKLRVVAGDLLEDADLANVKSATWTVTYTIPEGTAAGNGVGGGTYFGCKNSTGYWISPDYDDDGNAYWANTTYTAQDDAKFLLPTDTLAADSELVFMDWSNHEAITAMTVAISDLKFFDADGNEIAQKAYAGAAEATADTTADAPAADTAATTSTATGNASAAAIVGVMAVAGAAAIAAKKRK